MFSITMEDSIDAVSPTIAKAKSMGLSIITELLTILAVAPVTSCEAERSFSKLQLIKDDLRSTMTSER